MGHYCFVCWRLSVVVVVCSLLVSSVGDVCITLPAGGPQAGRPPGVWAVAAAGPASGRVGGRAADIAQRASTVTSR